MAHTRSDRPAAPTVSPAPGDPERTAVLQATAAFLALAMHESQRPVNVLGSALERMAQAIAHEDRPALERELAVCVENLQFHDRLMQQLTQIRSCITGLAAAEAGRTFEPGEASWSALKRELSEGMLADAQRLLLELLLPADAHGEAQLRSAPREGSVDLF